MFSITYQPPGVLQGNHNFDINLSIVHINIIEREAILSRDRSTYLYTRFTFDLICQYNPKATSYRGPTSQNAGGFPTRSQDQAAGRTDQALRHMLLQPKGRIIADIGGDSNFFKSPLDGYDIDCKNGPIPEFCNVIRVHGDKTLTVHWRVTTWVNECQNRNVLSPILSHRWTRSIVTDEDHFSTLRTDGEVIFRTDELARRGWTPDSFRRDLFHPVPAFCQRYGVSVTANEDGTGVTYSFYDQELAYNIENVPQGLTRIEAWLTAYGRAGNFVSANIAGAGRALGRAGNILAQPGNVGAFIGNGFDQVMDSLRTANSILPHYGAHYNVRCFGSRNANRLAMQQTAVGYILGSIREIGPGLLNMASEFIITHEHHGRVVEVQGNFSWGPENSIVGLTANILGPVLGGAIIPFFVDQTATLHHRHGQERQPFSIKRSVVNPRLPNSNGTRGTLLEQVVAQALTYPCDVPDAPALDTNTDLRIVRTE